MELDGGATSTAGRTDGVLDREPGRRQSKRSGSEHRSDGGGGGDAEHG